MCITELDDLEFHPEFRNFSYAICKALNKKDILILFFATQSKSEDVAFLSYDFPFKKMDYIISENYTKFQNFYTGGNEVAMDKYYKDMINRNLSLNIENKLWYSFFNGTSTKYIKCLDEKFFLTKNNFKKEHTALDVQNYIKER